MKRPAKVRCVSAPFRVRRRAPSGLSIAWLRTSPARVHHVNGGLFRHVEQRQVEQRPSQHFLVVHRLTDMVDPGQPGLGRGTAGGGFELDLPDLGQVRAVVDEMQQARAHAANGGNVQLARAHGLAEGRRPQSASAGHRVGGAVAPSDPRRRCSGPWAIWAVWAKPSCSVFKTDADLALLPDLDLFRHMLARPTEAHGGQQLAQPLGLGLGGGKLDKGHTLGLDPGRGCRGR